MTAEMWWELSLAWILRRHHLNLWLDGALEARGSGIHLLIFVIIRTPVEIDRALMFIWAAMLKTEKNQSVWARSPTDLFPARSRAGQRHVILERT